MGGILWHTQGSGKTLTMVWLAKWILTHWAELNARVLIVTDRDELDEQIEKTFTGVDENIARTKSGKDLLNRLNVYDDSLICSLVHKFGRRGGEATENDYDKYIEELKASLPADFEAKGNLVVFVDECHRTQSGKLHTAMKTIMPNAVFIGFTGTPLLKRIKRLVSKFSVHTSMLTNITKALPMASCWICVMNTVMSRRICPHRIVLTSGLM